MYQPEASSLDRLPTELREQIWEYALGLDDLNPRTIELVVRRKIDITQRLNGRPIEAEYIYTSPQSNPISTVTRRQIAKNLRTIDQRSDAEICRLLESRRVKKYIQDEADRTYIQVHDGERIYFTPGRDTIFISLHSLSNLFLDPINSVDRIQHSTGLQDIQRLAIPIIYNENGEVVPLNTLPLMNILNCQREAFSDEVLNTRIFGGLNDIVAVETKTPVSMQVLKNSAIEETQTFLKGPRREIPEKDLLDDLAKVWRGIDALFGVVDGASGRGN